MAGSELDPYFEKSENLQYSPSSDEIDGRDISPAVIADANAQLISRDVENMRKGSAVEGRNALSGIREMKREGLLPMVAERLQDSGNAKIQYDANGEIEHIVFAGKDGKQSDINVQNETVDGKTDAELRRDSVKQVNEYLSAAMADPMLALRGYDLAPSTQEKVSNLMSSYLKGDVQAMTSAAQLIMKNPVEMQVVDEALNRITIPSTFGFGKDQNGKSYLQTRTGNLQTVVIPESGRAAAYQTDLYGRPDFARVANLTTSMKSASDQALFVVGDNVRSAQLYLTMFGKLPADGYTNMKSLERAYRRN